MHHAILACLETPYLHTILGCIEKSGDLTASDILLTPPYNAHTHTLFLHAYTQREAEVGVIERLVLVNFMCHKKLDILLSPNVNFIVGRSGSESPLAS